MNKSKTLEEKQEKISTILNSLKRNSYQNVMILNSSNINVEKTINNIIIKIKKAGYIIKNIDKIGIRELPYKLNGNSTGYYVSLDILGNDCKKIDEICKEEERVMKFITIRLDN